MTEPEIAALVALLRVGLRPPPAYSELLEQHGSALAVLDRELSTAHEGQTILLPAHTPAELVASSSADIAAWTAHNIKLVTVLDRLYPENLRAVHDRPPLVFVAGRLEPADQRSLAVIGTRRPSDEGSERARAIARHLTNFGYTVVSGLAAGIDTIAHEATLTAGGRTVAVIGTGLQRSYPPENSPLQDTIATGGGAVVSQFWPDTPPHRKHFPIRNALMSGLTRGTVIVEATPTSGTRIQARLALAHGRPVFMHRSLLSQDWALALADRPGTYVFQTPSELTDAIERLWSTDALVAQTT